MPLEKGHFYEFGQFRLDSAERRLLYENQAVPLPPKSFDLLVFLLENHSRLVTKSQIFESVWAGSFVEESNLTVSVSAIRRALGEKDVDTPYIETVPKAGYRFVAPVRIGRTGSGSLPSPSVTTSPPQLDRLPEDRTVSQSNVLPFIAPASHEKGVRESVTEGELSPDLVPVQEQPRFAKRLSSRMLLLIALGIVAIIAGFLIVGYRDKYRAKEAATVQPARTLAILPFHNLKDEPKTDFLGFSLADAVITKLGRVDAIAVRPSSAVEKYRGQVIDIQRVGADLKVDTILAGNIVSEGDDLRITPQLIDVKTNKILWNGAIDLKYDKLLTVQDKVAQEIVKGLELHLSPSQMETLNARAAVSPVAYEYYLHGVDLYARGDFPTSIKMLQKSAEIDPNYALTWAQIGRAYTAGASFQLGGSDYYKKAQAAYQKALNLDPTQPETRIFMANLLTDTGRVEQAVPILRESLPANQNHAELHWELGYAYRYGGMLRESIAEAERAREIDPGVKITTSAVNGYLYTGNYDRFLQSLPEDNDSAFVLFYRGFAKYYQRDFEQAATYFDRAFELTPTMFQAQVGKALSYSMHREKEKGLSILREMEKRIRERGVGDPEAVYKVAQVYAELGDKASALRMLEYSVKNGFFPYPYFQNDRLLDSLRSESQFGQIMTMAQDRHQKFSSTFF